MFVDKPFLHQTSDLTRSAVNKVVKTDFITCLFLLATDKNGRISVHHKQGAMIAHFQFDRSTQKIGILNIKCVLKTHLGIIT